MAGKGLAEHPGVCCWGSLLLPMSPITPRCPPPAPPAAIRFGRMPRSEKAKLKAEILTCEQAAEDADSADLRSLAKRIHEAYLKSFNMNKVKARVILAGKTTNNPVGVRLFVPGSPEGSCWSEPRVETPLLRLLLLLPLEPP